MSQREADLEMLADLIGDLFGPRTHLAELTSVEVDAFAGMRFDMTAYHDDYRQEQLTDKQREWVARVHARVVPQYANLASRGLVPRGTPTQESKSLDAMLAGPKPLRPPPLPRPTGAPQRASKRHCGRQDEGCYAFVNGDCTCGCCAG